MRLTLIPAALAATTFIATAAPSAKAPREALPFIADDYPKALKAAKAEKKPIFLEAWAPW